VGTAPEVPPGQPTPADRASAGRKGNRLTLLLAFGCLGCIGLCGASVVALAVVPRALGYRTVKVAGDAMAPALHHRDFVFVQRRPGELAHGDIVMFLHPERDLTATVSRIVALPNETVRIDEAGQVFVDGRPVPAPTGVAADAETGAAMPELRLGPDEIWVMGDNRANADDSRSYGPVSLKRLMGKVVWRYWPAGVLGPVR
jgi:signal peptidase I